MPLTILRAGNEQLPYTFDHPRYDVRVVETALPQGDYSLPGYEYQVVVERKQVDDFIKCLQGDDRVRFKKELRRMSRYERACVIVEASFGDVVHGRYVSDMKAKTAVANFTALWVRYGVPFIFADNRGRAEYLTHEFLRMYAREIEKRFKILTKGQKAA